MRVLLIGAYGLMGGYVAARLLGDGHEIVGVGRDVAVARRREPRITWIAADLTATTMAEWVGHLVGINAVINCAGALQDGPRDNLTAVHVTGPIALAHACVDQGVRRFVHISAVGVEAGSGGFNRTKRQAEQALAALDLDLIVIRPGLVLAPAAYGGSALLRGLAAFPFFVPAIHAGSTVQVVSAEDVVACAVNAIQPNAPARMMATLISGERTTLAQVLLALRAWLGIAPAPVLNVPLLIGRLSAGVADGLAWLGWRNAMRSTAIAQLTQGVRGEPDEGARRLGFTPRSLQDILSGWPSGVQERWYARLYFLKPLALTGLAIFWIASGVIGLASRSAAIAQLTDAGFSFDVANFIVLAGACVDIALGLLVCLRRTARAALKGMVLITLAYLAGATLWRPDLWADPLGPLVKTAPAAVLALAALAMMDDR